MRRIAVLYLVFIVVSSELHAQKIDVASLPYRDCYALGLSGEIQGCIAQKYSDEKKRYEEARRAFLKNARDAGVLQPHRFKMTAEKEKRLWEKYVLNKCEMQSSSYLPDSYGYWLTFYQCQALEYKAKGEYYSNYNFP